MEYGDILSVAGTTPIVPVWTGGPIDAHGQTDPGMVRESNQDSFCIEHDIGVYLVADGMGGRAGGEVASRLAVGSICDAIRQKLNKLVVSELPERRAMLCDAVNFASLRIYERSLELPQYRGMGTTATMLWIPPAIEPSRHENIAIVAHVGDSRCYLLRAGLLYQVTDDHSLVNEQVKAGILARNDPLTSQMKNVITRCVGYQEEEEVDTFALRLFKHDRFLICSDGLTNKVRDLELADAMANHDLKTATSDLIHLANERGGEDNITVVVIEVQ